MYWEPSAPHGTLCEFLSSSYLMNHEVSELVITSGVVRLAASAIDENAPEFWNTILHANFDRSKALLEERGDLIALVRPGYEDTTWSKEIRPIFEALISSGRITVGEACGMTGNFVSEQTWREGMKWAVGEGYFYVEPLR